MRPILCLTCVIALGLAVPTQAATLPAGDIASMAKRTDGAPANERRAYPPSCLSYPLPAEPTGPVYPLEVTLHSDEESTDVTVEIWRVPCTRAGDSFKSATLLRYVPHDEDAMNEAWRAPIIRIAQGGIGFGRPYDLNGQNLVRIAEEPNTIVSRSPYEYVIFDRTLVLENILPLPETYPVNPGDFDFNRSFLIRVGGGSLNFTREIPAYEPTEEDYPTAFHSLPITGYMSSNWYAPGSGGEGIVVQVYERETSELNDCEDVGGGVILPFSFTWFTYGSGGEPFWIYGDACVPAADPTRVTVDAFYTTGLGFAGAFNVEDGERHPWGQVSFEFPACNEMTAGYESVADLPESVPAGSGSVDYIRLGNVNGLVCD